MNINHDEENKLLRIIYVFELFLHQHFVDVQSHLKASIISEMMENRESWEKLKIKIANAAKSNQNFGFKSGVGARRKVCGGEKKIHPLVVWKLSPNVKTNLRDGIKDIYNLVSEDCVHLLKL